MIIFPKLPTAVQMSKYPQNTMHVQITYRQGTLHTTHHTFAPVDLTAPKVAAGKNCVLFIYCRQENANFPPQIHTTWEGPYGAALYLYKSKNQDFGYANMRV